MLTNQPIAVIAGMKSPSRALSMEFFVVFSRPQPGSDYRKKVDDESTSNKIPTHRDASPLILNLACILTQASVTVLGGAGPGLNKNSFVAADIMC